VAVGAGGVAGMGVAVGVEGLSAVWWGWGPGGGGGSEPI